MLIIDLDGLAAAHARLAHAPGHDRRVAGHAAPAGQDALCLHDAVDVVRRRLHTHQNHLGTDTPQMLGLVGVEHHGSERRARRGRQSGGKHREVRRTIDLSVQHVGQMLRIDAQQGFLLVDQPLAHHVVRDLEGRLRRTLAVPGLEDI